VERTAKPGSFRTEPGLAHGSFRIKIHGNAETFCG
jgi:hypothetical protein